MAVTEGLDEEKYLSKEDQGVIAKIIEDPVGMIIKLCALIIVSSFSAFPLKVIEGNWNFPGDFCSVLLFGVATGLLLWLTIYREQQKKKRIINEVDVRIKLEQHRAGLASRYKLIDMTDRFVDIVEVGNPQKISTISGIIGFLSMQAYDEIDLLKTDVHAVQKQVTKVEDRLLKISQAMDTLLEMNGEK